MFQKKKRKNFNFYEKENILNYSKEKFDIIIVTDLRKIFKRKGLNAQRSATDV